MKPKLLKIKLLALDFDGVMTDNKVIINEKGEEAIVCSRADGYGINHILRKNGKDAIVISIEKNPIVLARCKKLEVECFNGIEVDNKLSVLKKICDEKKINLKEVCYVGNDIPDIECMKNVGFSIAVKDAEKEVKKIANYVTHRTGGNGAVREVCELLCKN